ncbi:hypothetical protein Hanom_Chr06g00551101 [Helianthus anomalus]
MELTGWMKMARFLTFWMQIRKNKPLDESCKTGQTSRTKMAFYSKLLMRSPMKCPTGTFYERFSKNTI